MSEHEQLVERIARAIYETKPYGRSPGGGGAAGLHGSDIGRGGWGGTEPHAEIMREIRADAKLAVTIVMEAMKTPSDAMLEAGAAGEERITGVGVLSEEWGLVSLPRPNRHSNIYALAALLGICLEPDDAGGFVTNKGRYLTRQEAFAMTGKGRGGATYSEDLW